MEFIQITNSDEFNIVDRTKEEKEEGEEVTDDVTVEETPSQISNSDDAAESTKTEKEEDGEVEVKEDKEEETVDETATTQEIKVPLIASYFDNRPCGVVIHEEKAYNAVVTPDRCLDVLEGDQEGERIEFEHATGVHVQAIENLSSSSDFIQGGPIPLCYDSVLWSYALRITRVKDSMNQLSLVSIGPHLGLDASGKKGSLGKNEPMDQTAPRILNATLEWPKKAEDGKEEIEKLNVVANRSGSLVGDRTFTTEELMAIADSTTVVRVTARITVEKAYFNLKKFIDLDKQEAISNRASEVLNTILKGEKPQGWDWVITVGQHEAGEPREYFVHKSAFGGASDCFAAVVMTGHSFAEHILHVTGEKRAIIPALHAEDMKTVIPLVYALHAPLPRWQRVSALGRALCVLFKGDLILSVLFPQWERALVKEAMGVDRNSAVAASVELVRLLTIVWSCPYGALPVAKRVLISALADTLHRTGEDEKVFIVKELVPVLGELNTAHLQPILDSVSRHLHAVRSVKKTGVKTTNDEWK